MAEECKCSLRVEKLSVRKDGRMLIYDVSFEVHHGEIMALIGRNGAGKTTLLKALLGRTSYSGSVRFFNSDGAEISKPCIGYVPQNLSFGRDTPVTVEDMLCANLSVAPVWLVHKKAVRREAEELLSKVGVEGIMKRKLGELSGGELQRVLLAFALKPKPDLLLLDEPVSAVDMRGIEVFYDNLTRLKREYHMPIIIVSHNLAHVRKYATGAVLLDRTVISSGSADAVLASDAVREIFGLV